MLMTIFSLIHEQKINFFYYNFMSTIKAFNIFDILDYNNVNLDILTETFNVSFYGKYISKWPEYCISIKNHFGGF